MSRRRWVAVIIGMVVGFAIGMAVRPPSGGVFAAIACGSAVLMFFWLRNVWRRRRRPRRR